MVIAPDLKESLAMTEKMEAEFITEIDNYIEKNGLDAPIETLPELRDGYEVEEILELNLKSAGITSVIWATGYKFDFSLVKLPIFDEDGYPIQKRGVTEYAGLYFIGLPFLHTIKSGLLSGVGDDAAYVASEIMKREKIIELE
jgi:putative flavoprotein involved in K+ transport